MQRNIGRFVHYKDYGFIISTGEYTACGCLQYAIKFLSKYKKCNTYRLQYLRSN